MDSYQDGCLRSAADPMAAFFDAVNQEVVQPVNAASTQRFASRTMNLASDQELKSDCRFVDYAYAWLDRRTISRRTHDNYRRLLTTRLLPTFGDISLRDISPAAVNDWFETLTPGAPTTRIHAYALMRSIMRDALTDRLIEETPCQIDGVTTSHRAARVPSPDAEEIAAIADAMPESYAPVVLMSAWLGIAFSELRELRRHDIDLNSNIVRVRRAVALVRGRYEVTTPKSTEGMRDIAVPAPLRPAIRSHLRDHVPPRLDALLFPSVSDPNQYLNPSVLNAMYTRARDVAGRPDVRIADLRRSRPQLLESSASR